jgi:hypothetical protein
MEFLLVQHRRALHLAIQAMRRVGVFNADPKGARMLLATTQDKGRFVRSSDRNKKLCIRNTFGVTRTKHQTVRSFRINAH